MFFFEIKMPRLLALFDLGSLFAFDFISLVFAEKKP